jgi:hypothetical protein
MRKEKGDMDKTTDNPGDDTRLQNKRRILTEKPITLAMFIRVWLL